MATGMFKNEQEWLEYVEEIAPIAEAHGSRFALKLSQELVKQYFDNKAARYEVKEAFLGCDPLIALAGKKDKEHAAYWRFIRENS